MDEHSSTDTVQKTRFFDAAVQPSIDKLSDLLSIDPTLADSTDDDGRTPMHRAAVSGHVDAVQMLMARQTNINHKDDGDWTALHSAASAGQTECVRTLVRGGAQSNIRNSSGATPLHHAASKGHVEIVEILSSLPDLDVNSKDNNGLTPLGRAVAAGKLNVVETLLKANAAVEEVHDRHTSENLLHIAANNNDLPMCRLLAKVCPRLVRQLNKENKSPIDCANREIAKMLTDLIERDNRALAEQT